MIIIRVVNNSELSKELNLSCHIVPVPFSSVIVHFNGFIYAGASRTALVLII